MPIRICEAEIAYDIGLQNTGKSKCGLVGPVDVLQPARRERRATVRTQSLVAVVRIPRKDRMFRRKPVVEPVAELLGMIRAAEAIRQS